MENKELTIEDKLKPYLILAKSMQYQIVFCKKQNPDADISEKERLIGLIMFQGLKQIKYRDLNINLKDYYDLSSEIYKELEMPDFDKYDEEIQNIKTLPLYNLINTLNDEGMAKVKEQLEKAEKEYGKQ